MSKFDSALTPPTRSAYVEAQVPKTQSKRSTSSAYVWYVVGLLAVVNSINQMDRSVLSILSPLIKVDLKISDTQLGLMTGLAFFLFYAVCGIPIARWADRGIRRNLICTALAIWSLITALCGIVQTTPQLFLTRIGVGIGEAGSFPASSSVIADYIPPKGRALAFSIQTFGLVSGTTLGLIVAGTLGQWIGWRTTFVAVGAPGVVIAAIVWLTLREPVRGQLDPHLNGKELAKDYAPSLMETIRYLWSRKTFILITLYAVANGFVQYGLNQWWPSFYVREFQLSLSAVGTNLGLAVGIGSAVGLWAGGFFGNKIARRDMKLPLVLGAFAILLSLPTACASLFVPSVKVSFFFISLTWVLWTLPYGSIAAASTNVIDPRMRATAGALITFATSVFGFGVGPSCVGLVSTLLTEYLGHDGLRYAMLVPICVIPVMTPVLCAAARALPHDIYRAA